MARKLRIKYAGAVYHVINRGNRQEAIFGDGSYLCGELHSEIRRNKKCEVAFIMVATIRQGHQDLPVGLAYCCRTWCHHLALEFGH